MNANSVIQKTKNIKIRTKFRLKKIRLYEKKKTSEIKDERRKNIFKQKETI